MDCKMLARLGAIVFVSFAITATAIEMTRKDAAPETDAATAMRTMIWKKISNSHSSLGKG